MRLDLAASDTILVPIPDGGELKVLRLAGHAGPVVLFLHANGFHIKCYTPLVSQYSPAMVCQHGLTTDHGILNCPHRHVK